jgi:hypothetical protein
MVDLDRLERALILAARERRPVTYGQLLGLFERRVTRINVAALCRDLGRVCERVEAAGGPDLACLVVRKSDGLPGDGYFAALRQDEGYDGPSVGPRAEALVRDRQERAFAWYGPAATEPPEMRARVPLSSSSALPIPDKPDTMEPKDLSTVRAAIGGGRWRGVGGG